MMRYLILLLIGMYAITYQAHGQMTFSIEGYLATALEDQALERYRAQKQFLSDNNYNSPWLNRVELRVGSEDANASLNEYRLRLSPTNPAEIKANKIYYNQHLESLTTKHQIVLNEALKNRYLMVIDLIDLTQQEKYLSKRIQLEEKILQNNAQQGMELKDIIVFQSNQTKHLLQHQEIKTQSLVTRYYIGLDYGISDTLTIDTDHLITVAQIKHYLTSTALADHQNLAIIEAEQELALNQQMLKIDKAEARSNIGYIQGNIDTERGADINDHLGFQVGIRLPIVNPDKPKLNRDRVKLIDEAAKVEATKSLVQNESKLNTLQLDAWIAQYEMLRQRQALAQKIQVNANIAVDWAELSKLKNYHLDLDMELAQLEKKIRIAFIEYLDQKGLLANSPLINYLSRDFQPIINRN
ncbi:hypothetical protein [Reichenbachiella sp. MSK19-1]|uniref:hypothetical protein n=1 Tax=Reichenbachiella sp. MSK19-1 TaxID=1897631 RepID=UPI000E6D1788|nr:hypothetical protein [Reichenbachiella sp. MSK19-1]RJE71732.1 hypothetical protein BGP76_06490 [Reichenbachiella sp. MSK19-1]